MVEMKPNWENHAFPEGATVITVLDAHAAGEPLRIVTGGLPELPGKTVLENRRYMEQYMDHLRKALMWEPRGHHEMYGCVLTPPENPQSELGVIFMHNEGYSTMCGHGVIALVTALFEAGAIESADDEVRLNLDTPAGLVRATAYLDGERQVGSVAFLNVPSFAYALDVSLELPEFGRVEVDVAFGGAFYAICEAEQVGAGVTSADAGRLVSAAGQIKDALAEALPIQHPHEPDLGFLYGTIFTGPPKDVAHHSRNVCVFASEEVDRSPTGTGVSARLALHHEKGEVAVGERITVESILGQASVFDGRVSSQTEVGPYRAVIPEVSGTAFITGRHEFMLDPRDELGKGFLLS